MSTRITLAVDCETCGEGMSSDLFVMGGGQTLHLETVVSQLQFDCDNCGGSTYLGDLEEIMHHEPGEERDEEE